MFSVKNKSASEFRCYYMSHKPGQILRYQPSSPKAAKSKLFHANSVDRALSTTCFTLPELINSELLHISRAFVQQDIWKSAKGLKRLSEVNTKSKSCCSCWFSGNFLGFLKHFDALHKALLSVMLLLTPVLLLLR